MLYFRDLWLSICVLQVFVSVLIVGLKAKNDTLKSVIGLRMVFCLLASLFILASVVVDMNINIANVYWISQNLFQTGKLLLCTTFLLSVHNITMHMFEMDWNNENYRIKASRFLMMLAVMIILCLLVVIWVRLNYTIDDDELLIKNSAVEGVSILFLLGLITGWTLVIRKVATTHASILEKKSSVSVDWMLRTIRRLSTLSILATCLLLLEISKLIWTCIVLGRELSHEISYLTVYPILERVYVVFSITIMNITYDTQDIQFKVKRILGREGLVEKTRTIHITRSSGTTKPESAHGNSILQTRNEGKLKITLLMYSANERKSGSSSAGPGRESGSQKIESQVADHHLYPAENTREKEDHMEIRIEFGDESADWWKQKEWPSVKEFFTFPNPIDESISRAIQSMCSIVLLVGLYEFQTYQTVYTMYFLAYTFLVRTVSGVRIDPIGQVAVRWVGPFITDCLGLMQNKFVAMYTKRFSNLIGTCFCFIIIILGNIVDLVGATVTVVIGWLFWIAMTAAAIHNCCIACGMFSVMIRLKLLPETVCQECNAKFCVLKK